ncbi:MAG: MurT ligase domain-containing protein, partial [Bifidobacteriaceae bacterium]|nr:MurT ligase domain-containing protein [Bifidobacteriaceae bacterium]
MPANRLPARSRAAIAAGKAAGVASRALGRGRGQVVGGRVMLWADPGLLGRLAAPMLVTCVSATNGKSTTTRLIAEALRTRGPVAHNVTGANMGPGVATALAANPYARFAALEVDEAHLPAVAAATRASQLVLMNLSRDQLDRGSEVKMLAERWRAMAEGLTSATRIIANADDPAVVWAAFAAPSVTWVGCGQWWTQDSALCPECEAPLVRPKGRWACPACGLARPDTEWFIAADSVHIVTPYGRLRPKLALPGRFNVGNAAIALAAVNARGVHPEAGLEAFARVEDVDGRYVRTRVGGREARLLLGKNPASWTEMMGLVDGSPALLVAVLNARGADGRDPSWIWDVDFEDWAGRPVWVAGERRYDLAVRLETAGLEV